MENNTDKKLGFLLNQIKYPLLTEKVIELSSNRQYAFIVDRTLNKFDIKYALENMFNITIISIKTCNLPIKIKRVGKFSGKKSLYKKAYVKLKVGDSITALLN
jgi:large subunit ribosomal protein L23